MSEEQRIVRELPPSASHYGPPHVQLVAGSACDHWRIENVSAGGYYLVHHGSTERAACAVPSVSVSESSDVRGPRMRPAVPLDAAIGRACQ